MCGKQDKSLWIYKGEEIKMAAIAGAPRGFFSRSGSDTGWQMDFRPCVQTFRELKRDHPCTLIVAIPAWTVMLLIMMALYAIPAIMIVGLLLFFIQPQSGAPKYDVVYVWSTLAYVTWILENVNIYTIMLSNRPKAVSTATVEFGRMCCDTAYRTCRLENVSLWLVSFLFLVNEWCFVAIACTGWQLYGNQEVHQSVNHAGNILALVIMQIVMMVAIVSGELYRCFIRPTIPQDLEEEHAHEQNQDQDQMWYQDENRLLPPEENH